VAEALDMLFRQDASCSESGDDAELQRQLEAELGPAKARTVPPLDPAHIKITHVVPVRRELIRRPGEEK
jgi:hypothetical protein